MEFRQHERPALRNSRHALCDVVDIHSGVRREPREDQAGCSDNKAGALLNDRNDLDLGGWALEPAPKVFAAGSRLVMSFRYERPKPGFRCSRIFTF